MAAERSLRASERGPAGLGAPAAVAAFSAGVEVGARASAVVQAAARSAAPAAPAAPADPRRLRPATPCNAQAVQKYGGAKAGYRTMLDALLPAQGAMQQALAAGAGAAEVAAVAAAAAAQGAEGTKGMAALAGRSSYVPEEVLRSAADPGARAVAVWLGAVAAALQ